MTRALWKAVYPLEVLHGREREMGTLSYSKEYLVTPRSETASLFPLELFEPCFTDDVLVKGYKQGKTPLVVVTGWDLAIALEGDTDYNVGFTVGMDPTGMRRILDIERFRHQKSYTDILNRIKKSARAFRPKLIVLETNGFQIIFKQMLELETDKKKEHIIEDGQRFEGHRTGAEKSDLETGVPGLRVLLENKMIAIPRGDERSISITDTWMSECQAFGWVEDKLGGVGEHDDTVMGWWFEEIALARVIRKPGRRAGLIAAGASRKN